MEQLDVYNDQMQFVGKTISRGTPLGKNENILLSLVYIRNRKGAYLIQKTSKEKGSVFSTTGGHVVHGEDALTTIVREIKEELGLSVSKEELQHVSTFKYPNKPCIFHVYLLSVDHIDLKTLNIQQEEVESVRWMNEKEIEQLIQEHLFLETHGSIFLKYIKK